jgi:DNA-binding response OmpR family regulator
MSSKKRILFVDDDPKSFYILTMILKLRDYEVMPYLNPEGALADFKKGAYDLLLIVVEMVDMNGFELYQQMKQTDRQTKVCFMTNFRQRYLSEFKRLFPELTSDSLVDKPLSTSDVMEILHKHLGK